MSTSHAAGLEVDGFPQERYQLYHEEKAKGGIALTMFGGSSNVAPVSPNIFRQLNVGVDEIIPRFQQFSERIHAHGRRSCARLRIWAAAVSPMPLTGCRPSAPPPSARRCTAAFRRRWTSTTSHAW